MSAGEPRKVGTRWWTDLGCRLWMGSAPGGGLIIYGNGGGVSGIGDQCVTQAVYIEPLPSLSSHLFIEPPLTRDRLAAGLLHDVTHGRGLVQEAELAVLVLLVGGVSCLIKFVHVGGG